MAQIDKLRSSLVVRRASHKCIEKRTRASGKHQSRACVFSRPVCGRPVLTSARRQRGRRRCAHVTGIHPAELFRRLGVGPHQNVLRRRSSAPPSAAGPAACLSLLDLAPDRMSIALERNDLPTTICGPTTTTASARTLSSGTAMPIASNHSSNSNAECAMTSAQTSRQRTTDLDATT